MPIGEQNLKKLEIAEARSSKRADQKWAEQNLSKLMVA